MYYAQIDSNNVVIQVLVADQDFVDHQPGTWVLTDIDGISPKNYAGIGHVWHPELNGFVPQTPYPSWVLNSSTCLWDAPIPMPTDGHVYNWNETTKSWEMALNSI